MSWFGLVYGLFLGGAKAIDSCKRIEIDTENRINGAKNDDLTYLDSYGQLRLVKTKEPVFRTINANGEDCLANYHTGNIVHNFSNDRRTTISKQDEKRKNEAIKNNVKYYDTSSINKKYDSKIKLHGINPRFVRCVETDIPFIRIDACVIISVNESDKETFSDLYITGAKTYGKAFCYSLFIDLNEFVVKDILSMNRHFTSQITEFKTEKERNLYTTIGEEIARQCVLRYKNEDHIFSGFNMINYFNINEIGG